MNNDELDRIAVERCLSGDVAGFAALIDRYERPVFNAIVHMVGSREDAQELCQQVFMKVFEHMESFDRRRKFFSWIYRVAMNETINFLKSRGEWQPLSESIEEPAPNPEERFATIERQRRLRRAILALEPKYRVLVILRHFLDFSYTQAAMILELPEKTVKSRLFTARRLLRDALTESGGYAFH